TIRMRQYDHETDYEAINDFLIALYQADPPRNWLQPRWEYAHSHPMLDRENLGKIPIWEDDGQIVAAVLYEDKVGANHVQLDPGYPRLKREVLDYAADSLIGDFRAGHGCYVHLDDSDSDLGVIAAELGFEPRPQHAEALSRFIVPEPFAAPQLPEGFRLQSLADEFDVTQVHRVMHRGFNHEGEPPADELEDRRRKVSVPGVRRDLTIVAVAPDGSYVSFCGMWPVPGSTACYVEPVATDPDYRRMGLAKACVMESIRRCAAEGATIAYVGSDLAFYLSTGFEVCGGRTPWWRATRS
ncbi:GNAT family N-acetyltransferase, partial [Candidatus Bipolaricaulota bacterium]|nr:GNAT family N-acetyltransferase [Candidatus Bipolaricaulota bacterium]